MPVLCQLYDGILTVYSFHSLEAAPILKVCDRLLRALMNEKPDSFCSVFVNEKQTVHIDLGVSQFVLNKPQVFY